MSDAIPIQFARDLRASGRMAPKPGAGGARVFFDRQELTVILNLYGRMVQAGEWRDYAIDGLGEKAVFSMFRRASEMPLYRIEKHPRLAQRQGQYALTNSAGLVLKRGRDLPQVLRVLERKLLKIVQ